MPTHCPSTPRAITWGKQFRKRIFRSVPHPGRERSQADTVFTADPSTLINNFNHIYLPSDPSFLFLTLLMPVLLFFILPAPLSPCARADSGVQNMHRFYRPGWAGRGLCAGVPALRMLILHIRAVRGLQPLLGQDLWEICHCIWHVGSGFEMKAPEW